MYERPRRARVVFIALMLAAVTVVTLDFRQRPDGPVEQVQRGVLGVFAPVQRAVSAVFSPVGDLLGGIGGLGKVRRENRELREEVERLRAAERGYQDLLTENEQLRGSLAMAKRCGCKTIGAQVIARSGSNFQWSVTIDAGSGEGIRKDMAVLNADGLVGRVVQVSDGYANVLLLNDPSSGVAATLAGNKATGLLRGQGDGDLELELLQAGARVKAGDPVVTQGYQQGVFPAGIPVGVVTSSQGGGLVRRAGVRPFADTETLDVVAVVLAKPERKAAPR
jgi:rod shape-determining protein MreC